MIKIKRSKLVRAASIIIIVLLCLVITEGLVRVFFHDELKVWNDNRNLGYSYDHELG